MARIVSFINMKGGVGKTTLSVNVAYGLAYYHKKKVLLVDADPQFNATQYLIDDDAYLKHINDPAKSTLLDVFVPKRAAPISSVSGLGKVIGKSKLALASATIRVFDGKSFRGILDIIPSTLALIDIETSKRGTENKLKKFLSEKAAAYDYIVIDCPPTISVFTQAAILASDSYLVPIKPDPLSVIGLPLLERWLSEFTDDAGTTVENIGLVFTMVRGPLPQKMQSVMDDLRVDRGGEVFSDSLSVATCVAESVEARQPVFLHSPNHKTAAQIRRITQEFITRTSGD